MAKKSRQRTYRLVKCAYCKGTGKDQDAGIFDTPACRTCKGVGKVKVLVKSR